MNGDCHRFKTDGNPRANPRGQGIMNPTRNIADLIAQFEWDDVPFVAHLPDMEAS